MILYTFVLSFYDKYLTYTKKLETMLLGDVLRALVDCFEYDEVLVDCFRLIDDDEDVDDDEDDRFCLIRSSCQGSGRPAVPVFLDTRIKSPVLMVQISETSHGIIVIVIIIVDSNFIAKAASRHSNEFNTAPNARRDGRCKHRP